jgi:fatty acid desaturase
MVTATAAPKTRQAPAKENDLDRRQMYAEIKRLCAPDNYTNIFVLLGEYALLSLAIGGCLSAYYWVQANGWSLWWMVPVYAATVFFIGVWTQNRLGVLIHEGSHYSLFKNRVVNDIVTNLFESTTIASGIGGTIGTSMIRRMTPT